MIIRLRRMRIARRKKTCAIDSHSIDSIINKVRHSCISGVKIEWYGAPPNVVLMEVSNFFGTYKVGNN